MRVLDTGNRKQISALVFAPTRPLLIVGTGNGAAVHDLACGRDPVRIGPAEPYVGTRAGCGADDRAVYAVTRDGRTAFDLDTGARTSSGPSDPSDPGQVSGFVGSADGSRLVTIHAAWPATRLVGWRAAAGGWERAWLVAQGNTAPPALSPAGDRLALVSCLRTGEWVYQFLLRDAVTGELVATGSYGYAMSARPLYRADGRQVVAAHDMTLVVWDTRMPAKPQLVRNDSRRHFTAAAYHPSGRYLFTTSNDATVTVWDTENWVRVNRYDWDVGRLRAVAVSPDGLLAAAGSDRGRVVVWDVDL